MTRAAPTPHGDIPDRGAFLARAVTPPPPGVPMHAAVLVGGRSSRFGRDKLREPVGADTIPLVSIPIAALREVFGPRVHLVGLCDDAVAALGDFLLPDAEPGAGPIGGILTALEALGGSVFVLAGDMPRIDASTIRAVLSEATRCQQADAILAACDGRVHPCVGVYRASAATHLRRALARGEHAIHRALGSAQVHGVDVPRAALANINTLQDAASCDRDGQA